MEKAAAAKFIRDNFEPEDRLAVVILNKQSGTVTQRLAFAEQIASHEFHAWLRFENSRKSDIYCTPNVLGDQARGRTKEDVQSIRHVYLDFDYHGTAAVERLKNDPDVPTPNYLVSTSPEKWQALWRVEGFDKLHAEELQRAMAREYGADLAATDCSRVLRLPGFYNHKYAAPHYVRATELTRDVYSPERFPKMEGDQRGAGAARVRQGLDQGAAGPLSQSERDWAYARRALARGDAPETVARAVAEFRRDEKVNILDYADRTVRKAAASLAIESPTDDGPDR
jgi:hypothetical protein